MLCPKDFSKAEYIKDENYENFVDTVDLDHMIAEKEGVYLGIGNRLC